MIRRSLLIVIAASAVASCSTDVEVGNAPSQVVAIGPVWLADDRLVVETGTWDHEGDTVALVATAVTSDGSRTTLSAAALAPYQLSSLPTERSEETRQLFEWQFGLDGIAADAEISLEIATSDEGAPALVFGPFVPGALAPAVPLPPPAP